LGAGGGGGRIGIGAVGLDFALPVVTIVIGPLTAPTGTRAETVLSEVERTLTDRSSPRP
jgi:hypothetical protein